MSEYTDLHELVTFRPLSNRLSYPPGSMKLSPFKASWSSTVKLLARELRAHGARRGVMEIDLREQDFRLDGLPRGDRSARSPGIVLSFTAGRVPGAPALRYEVTRYSDWRDNVRAVALALEALRAVDRYGVTRRGEQYAGWKSLTAGAGDGDAARGHELIRKHGGVARALHAAHPDHGGNDQDFRDVIAARNQSRNKT